MSTNPFTLEAFLGWVERQLPGETYDWFDGDKCACSQYAGTLGFSNYRHLLRQADDVLAKTKKRGFWLLADRAAQDASITPGQMKGMTTFGNLADVLRQHILVGEDA